eukprot:GILJ01008420.1.p1 GENE.GILJ01008420.1~~GILJ01008420.1.p1  ORF type:complete len:447 (-),score=97.61 GILJ01008420.1:216-1556(-)
MAKSKRSKEESSDAVPKNQKSSDENPKKKQKVEEPAKNEGLSQLAAAFGSSDGVSSAKVAWVPVATARKMQQQKTAKDGDKETGNSDDEEGDDGTDKFVHPAAIRLAKKQLKDKLRSKTSKPEAPRLSEAEQAERNARTIFVGNVPLTATEKTLRTHFKQFVPIESVRFRSIPVAEGKMPRKGAAISKTYRDDRDSQNAYIVFKTKETADAAVELNGSEFEGKHIRVDLAEKSQEHDYKTSIFVGNLPFSISEEQLRQHFADCGKILNVRVVRDPQTSIGKGIAYLQFEEKDSIAAAVQKSKSKIDGRQLRVTRAVEPKRLMKKQMRKQERFTKRRDPKDGASEDGANHNRIKSPRDEGKVREKKPRHRDRQSNQDTKHGDGEKPKSFEGTRAGEGDKLRLKPSHTSNRTKDFKGFKQAKRSKEAFAKKKHARDQKKLARPAKKRD